MRNCKKRPITIFILLLIVALAGLNACTTTEPRPSVPKVEDPKPEGPKLPRTINLSDVEEAYNSGDLLLAERLASEFTNRTNIDARQLGRGWRVLALSSLANGRPRVAITALDRWRLTIEGADATPEWYRAWYQVLTELPFDDAVKRAEAVIASSATRPAVLVREARLFILEQRFAQGDARASIPGLEAMYEESDRVQEKRDLEERLWRVLHTARPGALNRLLAQTTDENERRFPYALIRLENARRTNWDVRNQGLARENVGFIRDGSQLVNKDVFRTWNEPDYTPLANVRVRNHSIALVLPMSGAYGNLSEKIARGADIARRGLETHGQALRIYVIDSDQPNWLHELNNLPRSVRVVGGPLRLDDYTAIKNMGFGGGRFLFAFLPRMDDDDEGLYAWRFFPSREDQVRVMLDYSQRLGVTDYAIYAPDSGDYSQGMFELFYAQAMERDRYVNRAGYYPDKQYQLWSKSVAEFLGSAPGRDGKPRLDFQAMFLPDNWGNSSRIISHVFYNMENHILFMGTNLWEHGLAGQQRLALRNYRLAIFPGAWDMQTLTPAGQIVRTGAAQGGKFGGDFWVSLGFDFALAASSLNLPENARPDDVNEALAYLPNLPWSGAPISWDRYGFARQELFVLTPAESGFVLANPERLRERLKSSNYGEEPAEEAMPSGEALE